MLKSTNMGRWSLCIIPSSLIPAPTLYAVDVLCGEYTCIHTSYRQPGRNKTSLTRPLSQVYSRSGKCTYHLRLLPPRTKSILCHSFVTVGDQPVKVAELAETLNLGVTTRVSKNLKSGTWLPPGVYFSVNFLSTFIGGIFPVIIP